MHDNNFHYAYDCYYDSHYNDSHYNNDARIARMPKMWLNMAKQGFEPYNVVVPLHGKVRENPACRRGEDW
jgi:hypothetical protein